MKRPSLLIAVAATVLGTAAAAQNATTAPAPEKNFWEEEGNIENQEPPKVPAVGPDGQLYPGIVRRNTPINSPDLEKAWSDAKARATPRIGGKPDLTGFWMEASFRIKGYADNVNYGRLEQLNGGAGGNALLFASRAAAALTMENDSYIWRRGDPDKPLYKPEHWAKVRELDLTALQVDDQYHCRPIGVPRLGRPNYAIQREERIVFMNGLANESNLEQFRIIRVNQPHDQQRVDDYGPKGSSVATWDNDTLVVETKGLSPETWLGPDGLFHSTKTRVIERITRTGDTVEYQVTVEDPEVLAKPWVRDVRYYTIVNDPKLTMPEVQACSDRNAEFVPGAVH